MYCDDVFIIAAVGVGIESRRLSMGRPPGMPDAAGTLDCLAVVGHFLEYLQLPLGFDNLHLVIFVPDSDARVIASVFQLGQTVQQNGCCLLTTGKSYNSAHKLFSSQKKDNIVMHVPLRELNRSLPLFLHTAWALLDPADIIHTDELDLVIGTFHLDSSLLHLPEKSIYRRNRAI